MQIDIFDNLTDIPNIETMTKIGGHKVRRTRDNYVADYFCVADFGNLSIDEIKTRAANQANILAANSRIRENAEGYDKKVVVLRIDTIGTSSSSKPDSMMTIGSVSRKCAELGLTPIQAVTLLSASGITTTIEIVQSFYPPIKSDSITRPGLTERQLFNPTNHDHDDNDNDNDNDVDDVDDVDDDN